MRSPPHPPAPRLPVPHLPADAGCACGNHGATRRDLLRYGAAAAGIAALGPMRGLLPVASGTFIGIVAAIGLARVAARFLYGVTATDPLSIGLAGAALLASGTVAALLPAWRAARVSPTESLRSE